MIPLEKATSLSCGGDSSDIYYYIQQYTSRRVYGHEAMQNFVVRVIAGIQIIFNDEMERSVGRCLQQ